MVPSSPRTLRQAQNRGGNPINIIRAHSLHRSNELAKLVRVIGHSSQGKSTRYTTWPDRGNPIYLPLRWNVGWSILAAEGKAAK